MISLKLMLKTSKFPCLFYLSILCFYGLAQDIPSPEKVLGFRPTTERTIADWQQITNYFSELDKASDRVSVKRIGRTTLGRTMIAVFISDAKNLREMEKYRQVNLKLANPFALNEQEAESLIKQGKVIVAISCSIHSTEIVASQMSMNLAYELAKTKDQDLLEILRNVILILIPSANPDGIDIVANWYRKTLNTKAEGTNPPEL